MRASGSPRNLVGGILPPKRPSIERKKRKKKSLARGYPSCSTSQKQMELKLLQLDVPPRGGCSSQVWMLLPGVDVPPRGGAPGCSHSKLPLPRVLHIHTLWYDVIFERQCLAWLS